MTPQEARKLVADALRSGEYQQGRKALCRMEENTYCCLGVACEVFIKNGGELEVGEESVYVDDRHQKLKTFGGGYSWLPPVVQQWLDIDNRGYYYAADSTLTALYIDNDEKEKPFAEIADLFETATFVTSGVGHAA